ncbi:sigma-70 family RNA polymerase sigma factor [Priestia megaterium]|uniref:sigma-70 family RNA polymerase sigma factor n=1 Tax=Priestia megaterium TaxID=1404 RepID=UPI002E1EB514|nr:sigma-70 family RNA polymerase sigma factor [Priestia megaterium]
MDNLSIKEMDFRDLEEQWCKLLWKFSRQLKKNIGATFKLEEIYNIGLYGLWKAQMSYKENREASFITHLYANLPHYMRNEILKEKVFQSGLKKSQYLKKTHVNKLLKEKEENCWSWEQTKQKSILSEKDWVNAYTWNKRDIRLYQAVSEENDKEKISNLDLIASNEFLDVEEEIVEKEILDKVISKLNDSEKNIFNHRINLGYTLRETARKLNVKRSTLQYREKKLIEKIKKILIKEQIPAA